MKKVLGLLVACTLLAGLTGCNKKKNEKSKAPKREHHAKVKKNHLKATKSKNSSKKMKKHPVKHVTSK